MSFSFTSNSNEYAKPSSDSISNLLIIFLKKGKPLLTSSTGILESLNKEKTQI